MQSIADYFRHRLGWRPSRRPFVTTADRLCGSCHVVKRGGEFNVLITPGRPDLDTCTTCQPTGVVEAIEGAGEIRT